MIQFDINIITPGGGGHVLTVHQEHKDRLPQLVVIAGEPCESLAVEAMMERLMGESLLRKEDLSADSPGSEVAIA